MAEEFVVVGKITSVHGIKGAVKVHSYTKPRLNITNYNPWYLKIEGKWQKISGVKSRAQGKTIVAELPNVADRTAAEALSGVLVGIANEQLPNLQDGEFYWRDLVGMRVVNQEKQDFGIVTHLVETGANDVLVVKEDAQSAGGESNKRKERMIPFIADAVVDVDATNRLIQVEWDADF